MFCYLNTRERVLTTLKHTYPQITIYKVKRCYFLFVSSFFFVVTSLLIVNSVILLAQLSFIFVLFNLSSRFLFSLLLIFVMNITKFSSIFMFHNKEKNVKIRTKSNLISSKLVKNNDASLNSTQRTRMASSYFVSFYEFSFVSHSQHACTRLQVII